MVDYPGRLAATVFTAGCNWNCFYCHNKNLINPVMTFGGWDVARVLQWLDTRTGLLDAVVVSGGEPTIQPGLAEFLRDVRAKGFRTKLDTNGTRPDTLAALLEEGLLDYVAMDIKAPLEKYEAFCGLPVEHAAINRSIDMLLREKIDYEFRTTAVPQLTENDILAIGRRIRGARNFFVQQYRPLKSEGWENRPPPHPADWPDYFLDQLGSLVQACDTRGFQTSAKTAVA
jgi:pyruvate formate lyase activating enzyme